MKIEMDETTSVTTMVVAVVIGFAVTIMFAFYQSAKTTREKIEAGLEQKIVPGRSVPIWVAKEEEGK